MKFRFICAAALPALIVLAGAACSASRASAERAETTSAPTVAVARVTKGDIAQSLTIAAEFRPFQEIEVHAKVAGFLKSISVDVGDRVKTGQLLAVLEIPELQEEIKQDAAAVKRGGGATVIVSAAACSLRDFVRGFPIQPG